MNKTLTIAALALLLPGAALAEETAAAKADAKPAAESKTEAKASEPKVAAKTAAASTEKTAAKAEDSGWFSAKLKVIKTRINRKMQSASVRTSAVAAVRGDKTDNDALAPDWKGSADEQAAVADEKERAAVTAAFEKIVAGKNADGAADLKKFLAENPKSAYAEIAREALDKLQASCDKAEKAPAAKTAPAKTETK